MKVQDNMLVVSLRDIIAVASLILLLLLCSSCASITPIYDPQGHVTGVTTYRVCTNLEYEQILPDGSKIIMKSTATEGGVVEAINGSIRAIGGLFHK